MANFNEDVPQTSGPGTVETDLSDETQDFRFLNSLLLQDPTSSKIPKRGEKDFEPHATNLQADTLAASRDAMHAAISFPRFHNPKTQLIAYYDVESGGSSIDRPSGPFQKSMGAVKKGGSARDTRLWLLPEETLYLLERGSLDVRWPSGMGQAGADETVQAQEEYDGAQGIPMSLQGAYAAFLGMGPSPPTLEQYLVYSGLKRAGYIVFRAETWGGQQPGPVVDLGNRPPPAPGSSWGLDFFWELWRRLTTTSTLPDPAQLALGPLVKPGLYRNYAQLYHMLHIIPFHDPRTAIHPCDRSAPQSDPTFHINYHVYKPSPKFKKSTPGPADFRIAVVSARETVFPTLAQLSTLLDSTPYDPPRQDAQLYQKLKHGYRNVLLAIVDQGVVSYLRVAEAAFGCERLYKRKAKNAPRNQKGGAPRTRQTESSKS